MTLTAQDIDCVYAQIAALAAQAGARRVVLFGSRATGCAQAKSDIDLAIEGCPHFDVLSDRLQNELWSLLALDIINLDEPISDELRAEIERDGVVLYEEV